MRTQVSHCQQKVCGKAFDVHKARADQVQAAPRLDEEPAAIGAYWFSARIMQSGIYCYTYLHSGVLNPENPFLVNLLWFPLSF